MPDYTSFIEVQFPVSRVSKESFKERKANLGQTLTGLGKWWGRKPLVMVRAALLGLLMPAGDDPEKDMKVFLKIMTMDDEGLLLRKYKSVPVKDLYFHATDEEKKLFFEKGNAAPRIKKSVGRDEKKALEDLIFNRLGYDERIKYCRRPEEVELVDEEAWWEINAHLGTKAGSLAELMRELGMRRFGKVPTVGDCFCGGGSVPHGTRRVRFGPQPHSGASHLGGAQYKRRFRRGDREAPRISKKSLQACGRTDKRMGNRAQREGPPGAVLPVLRGVPLPRVRMESAAGPFVGDRQRD